MDSILQTRALENWFSEVKKMGGVRSCGWRCMLGSYDRCAYPALKWPIFFIHGFRFWSLSGGVTNDRTQIEFARDRCDVKLALQFLLNWEVSSSSSSATSRIPLDIVLPHDCSVCLDSSPKIEFRPKYPKDGASRRWASVNSIMGLQIPEEADNWIDD